MDLDDAQLGVDVGSQGRIVSAAGGGVWCLGGEGGNEAVDVLDLRWKGRGDLLLKNDSMNAVFKTSKSYSYRQMVELDQITALGLCRI